MRNNIGMFKSGSDNHRFPNRKWVLTTCPVGNLWISEVFLRKLENIFSKYIFLQTTIVKPQSETWETLVDARIFLCSLIGNFYMYIYRRLCHFSNPSHERRSESHHKSFTQVLCDTHNQLKRTMTSTDLQTALVVHN